ncbi:MAG: EF-hand domain-containing protein [Pseudomonadota bacterium]
MKRAMCSLKAITLIAGVMLVSNGAGAGDMAEGNKQLTEETQQQFSQLDINRDGYINKDEAQKAPALLAKFSKLDRNRDKRVDEGEFARFEVTDPHQ